MHSNDRNNTSGVRLGQVRQLTQRSPSWSRGEPVSARKLNQMSELINRNVFAAGPGAQQTPQGSGGGGSSVPVDATILGQIRFFSE
jgi:hypothetical protein